MNTTDTIFTKIIAREIPATIVYEDETVLAFLDNRPVQPGHTLVIPKEPYVNIFDIPSETIAHMATVAKQLAIAIQATVAADGVNVVMNNGEAAGQEVFHAHLHIIPRYQDDGRMQGPVRGTYDTPTADEVAEAIQAKL